MPHLLATSGQFADAAPIENVEPGGATSGEEFKRAKLHLVDCAAFVAGALYQLEQTRGANRKEARAKAIEARRTLNVAIKALGA